MSDSVNGGGRGGSTGVRVLRQSLRLSVAVFLVVAALSGAGVAEADTGQENENAPCAYDNPNRGGDNAAVTGLASSEPGVRTAADRIC